MARKNVEIQVLLADQDPVARADLRRLLDEVGGLKIVAEATTGLDAVNLAAAHRPQLVFMDIAMPLLDGVQATSRILDKIPQARVVIVSNQKGEEHVLRALRAGASGYIHKGATGGVLRMAIDAVARGEIFLSAAVSRRALEIYLNRSKG
jgi:DNA-binding NarL/FixJ family response regulator